MARYIEISDNGYVWRVPIHAIANNRASYYAEKGDDYGEEYQYTASDSYEAIDWMQNNMDWDDYSDVAELVKSPSRTEPSNEAEYRIVEE